MESVKSCKLKPVYVDFMFIRNSDHSLLVNETTREYVSLDLHSKIEKLFVLNAVELIL